MEIMAESKRAKIISILVILEAYNAYIIFLLRSWRPITTL